MIVHGDKDPVPSEQGEEMFTALKRLNTWAQFVRYWGEEHGIESPQNQKDLWAEFILGSMSFSNRRGGILNLGLAEGASCKLISSRLADVCRTRGAGYHRFS